MKRFLFRQGPFTIVLVLGFLVVTLCDAQTPPTASVPANAVPKYRNRLLGVYDEQSGDPLEGVEVRDLLTGLSSVSTSTGTVGLFFLPDGGGMVRLRKLGYATQTFLVSISPADTLPLTIVMSNATALPAVVTTGKASNPVYASTQLRGFEDRAKMGLGHYIMYEDIRKNEHMSLADMLRRLGGLSIVTTKTASYAVSTRCSGGGDGLQFSARINSNASKAPARATVFLDGVQLGSPDLNILIPTTEIAGVEWYSSGVETPMEYMMTSSGCGVLMIWTRAK